MPPGRGAPVTRNAGQAFGSQSTGPPNGSPALGGRGIWLGEPIGATLLAAAIPAGAAGQEDRGIKALQIDAQTQFLP